MSSFIITLPDGSQQTVPSGTKPLDVAKGISPRLADAAIVARVNGELYDLTRPFESDAKLEILTNKNPEALQVYRHSTAHLLAAAVLELYPETQLGIGSSHRQPASITTFSATQNSRPMISQKSRRECKRFRRATSSLLTAR